MFVSAFIGKPYLWSMSGPPQHYSSVLIVLQHQAIALSKAITVKLFNVQVTINVYPSIYVCFTEHWFPKALIYRSNYQGGD